MFAGPAAPDVAYRARRPNQPTASEGSCTPNENDNASDVDDVRWLDAFLQNGLLNGNRARPDAEACRADRRLSQARRGAGAAADCAGVGRRGARIRAANSVARRLPETWRDDAAPVCRGARAQAIRGCRQRPPGAGQRPRRPRQPADGPRDGQSHLASSLRHRPGPQRGRLRPCRRCAVASGVAGLPGGSIRCRRLVHEAIDFQMRDRADACVPALPHAELPPRWKPIRTIVCSRIIQQGAWRRRQSGTPC